jgi:hypothetical protein
MGWITNMMGISGLKYVLMGLVAASVIGVYLIGRTHGYDKAVQENNLERVEVINENIDTRKKQDRIVPIAGKSDLINRLRDNAAL